MNPPVLSEFSRRAMATDFVIMLPGKLGKNAETAVLALAEADRIESLLSIYRLQSDVSRLNQAAGLGPIAISQDAWDVLCRSLELSRLTGGAFDVTAGPLVEAWGFTRRQGAKPSEEILDQARRLVGFERLRLSRDRQTAELAEPGMSVNLGAIGKGFALDKIAEKLEAGGITDFLIHGGKSSVLVRGDDLPGSQQGWKVAVEHPQVPGMRLGGLRLKNESIGTSGSGKQFFHHQGKRLGHVIDPRTGLPTGDMLSVTVVSNSAMDADALATALFVMGHDAAFGFASRFPAFSGDGQGTADQASDPENSDQLTRSDCRVGLVAVTPTGRQAGVGLRRSGLREDSWIDE